MEIYIEDSGLSKPRSSSRAGRFRSLWAYRGFIIADARAQAWSSQRNLKLGRFWLFAQPFLDAALYGVVFGYVLGTSSSHPNFIGYLILGLTSFTLLQRSLVSGIGSIERNQKLIESFALPQGVVPFSSVLTVYLDVVPTIAVAALIALSFQGFANLHLTIMWPIALLPLIFPFCLGLNLMTSRLTQAVPDSKVIVTFFSRLWFYGSGVFYSIERFVTNPTLQRLMELNPAYQFLSAMRSAVLDGQNPTSHQLAILATWSAVTIITGSAIFAFRSSNAR